MNVVRSDDPARAQVYLAAERTLLAWIRTGIAMMGLGYVVARFGLFLREIRGMESENGAQVGFSLVVGTTILILGVGLVITAAVMHWRSFRRLSRNQPLRFTAYSLGFVVAVLLATIGTIMTVSLIYVSLQPLAEAASDSRSPTSVESKERPREE